MSKGLRITRRFTKAGSDPYKKIEWSKRDSRITNPDGSIVFEMTGAEIPAEWSQVASDIMVSKYFRKAGVPSSTMTASRFRRVRPAGTRTGGLVQAGVRSTRRHMAALGREGGLLRNDRGCRRIRGRAPLHARHSDGRSQLAAGGSTPGSTTPMA